MQLTKEMLDKLFDGNLTVKEANSILYFINTSKAKLTMEEWEALNQISGSKLEYLK